MSLFDKLFIQYNQKSDNIISLTDKVKSIKSQLSIETDFPMFFVGLLNDFIVNEPQYYFNKDVEAEVLNNLNTLYLKDKEKLINAFYEQQNSLFHSINSYYSVLDLYNEFNDVSFNDETKIKIYYLPIITQLMEFCLNHFYRTVLYIIDDFVDDKDYKKQTKLGAIKDILVKFEYKYLTDININLRNAISHGLIENNLNGSGIIYSYQDKKTHKQEKKVLTITDLNDITNQLLDISSGAFVGIFKFILQNNLINETFLSKMDNNIQFELLKLFLHNENIRVKSISKDNLDISQLKINIDIKNINNENQIIHILIWIGKIVFVTFNNYDRYEINYSHPFSLNGQISFTNEHLNNILLEEDISEIDKIFAQGATLTTPDIQNINTDNRSYKFHTFPKLSGENWEVISLKDNSLEGIKRFEAKLIIDDKDISKKKIENLLFYISKKIRMLENKSNPLTKIKYEMMEADIVSIFVFYKTNIRNSFSLLQNNENFICITQYHKSKNTPKISIFFQDNYNFESLKKFDIYWSKRLKNEI